MASKIFRVGAHGRDSVIPLCECKPLNGPTAGYRGATGHVLGPGLRWRSSGHTLVMNSIPRACTSLKVRFMPFMRNCVAHYFCRMGCSATKAIQRNRSENSAEKRGLFLLNMGEWTVEFESDSSKKTSGREPLRLRLRRCLSKCAHEGV